jgi:hypothetical protein
MTKVILGTRQTSGWPEFAGSTWVRLQYMLGLQKLGVEAFWVDRLKLIDPLKHHHTLDYLVRRFDRMASDFGFQDRYSIVYNGGERHFGMDERQLTELIEEADLLINVSGHLSPDSPLMNVPRRAYLDVDPGFTQIWAHENDMGIELHNFFFTVGQNVGGPGFTIPTRGVDWQPILPPVVLEEWPACIGDHYQRFSTVADWRGSQRAIFEGKNYGSKRDEFVRILRLPVETKQRMELALCLGPGDHEDLGLLHLHNWCIRDSAWYTSDPHSYREFIQNSRAEFSVAKSGYVRSSSGWVSDRTACYLASGKPVVAQSTGFDWPTCSGKGVVTFRTLEEAVEAIENVNQDYPAHCRAARQIAEERFDSDKVLGFILDRVGLLCDIPPRSPRGDGAEL